MAQPAQGLQLLQGSAQNQVLEGGAFPKVERKREAKGWLACAFVCVVDV